jgi:hypothetical protein
MMNITVRAIAPKLLAMSVLGVGLSAQADVASLQRVMDNVDDAMRLAGVDSHYNVDFYRSALKLDDVVFGIRREAPSPEQQRVISSAQVAQRVLRDIYASDFTKTSAVRREGFVMKSQIQRLIQLEEGRWDHPNDPGDEPGYEEPCNTLVDALDSLDRLVMATQSRRYRSAESMALDVQRLLDRTRFDDNIRRASRAMDQIILVLRDSFADDYSKQAQVRRLAADAKEFIVRSETYRRERGGYNPPPPRPTPPYPYPPEVRTAEVSCASWDRQHEVCRAPFVIGRVLSVRNYSNVRCVEGLNYRVGFDSVEVWDGCRAGFVVEERRGRDRRWDRH